MKKVHIIFILLSIALLYACSSAPKNFSYFYKNKNTGLNKKLNLNGYYVSEHGCDSSFFSMYMFYDNGLFSIATTSRITTELIRCFERGGTSNVCKYPLWGTYEVIGDTVRTQVIRPEGNGCVIFRDYIILPNKRLVNVSDYVEPQYTNLGYMSNYPSFSNNQCHKAADFYPMEQKRDSTACPFLNKKWFWTN